MIDTWSGLKYSLLLRYARENRIAVGFNDIETVVVMNARFLGVDIILLADTTPGYF